MEKFKALCQAIVEDHGEIFTFLTAQWDVDEAEKYIKKNKVPIEDIVLSDLQGMLKKFIRINTKHRDAIPDERIEEPGIVVDTEHGPMLIDGWHRAAALIAKGKKTMKCYYITDEKALKKIRIR